MFIECIQHGIRGINIGDKFKVLGVEKDCYIIRVNNSDENIKIWNKYFKEVEDNKMTKNFKEVIADIKEGEVWESKELLVFIDSKEKEIVLSNKTERFNCKEIGIQDVAVFTLQRQKVSFTEAFKAYEEGKEIESCVNGDKFEVREYHSKLFFTIEQIKGEWYINEN